MRKRGAPLRFGLQEASGALGDLGTLVPLSVGLIALNGFHPVAVFLPAGLLYLAAGLWYRLPLPVQPLKSMAAVALAMGFGPRVMSAGSILFGVALIGLAATGFINQVTRLMSKPLVRGIQVSVGVLLVWSGSRLMISQPVFGTPAAAVAVGLATCLVLVVLGGRQTVPAALMVLVIGGAAGAFFGPQAPVRSTPFLPPAWPRGAEWMQALVFLLLPQIPLTLANAVCATWQTARDYFGEDARRVTHRSLALGMGLTGLVAGSIGGMPVCHGSGGLTAHYRLGARSGGAPVMMGIICLGLAALAASGRPLPLGIVPQAVYGGMLLYVGAHHALLARDLARFPSDICVVLTMGLVTAATGNIGAGFVSGIGLLLALAAAARVGRVRANARA